ncbi:MAG: hypothetical protein LH679_18250, partial [Cyanobacteria bacterium CAN_BIN43]|nr:hypothetical protein [Cyanobacteria bacterium CAN_BIN43]
TMAHLHPHYRLCRGETALSQGDGLWNSHRWFQSGKTLLLHHFGLNSLHPRYTAPQRISNSRRDGLVNAQAGDAFILEEKGSLN